MMRHICAASLLLAMPVAAEDLFRKGSWPAVATDRKATAVGDIVTVIVFQQAQSATVNQNNSRKQTSAGGRFAAGSIDERADLEFGGGFSGRGEVRREERLVTQLSATVETVLPNGDLLITGRQSMRVNGETTLVAVRGRVRLADIDGQNRVLSTSIADAEINYNGKGFVSRSSKPGLINRLFSVLGLG